MERVGPTECNLGVRPAEEELERLRVLKRAELGLAEGAPAVAIQVTHSGPTLSTVAPPQAIQRLNAPGVGPAQMPCPKGAHVARVGARTGPARLPPSGQ